MEDRLLLAMLTVSNLGDAGAGSLRQALLGADAASGASTINFTVAGTITLTSGALPAITAPVKVDGTTAPGFDGSPVVEINDNGFGGLQYNAGSAESALRSLGVINAAGAGVTLNDSKIVVVGNFIGLGLNGTTPAGNGGDGLVINASSTGNTIGATTTLVPNISANAISLASNVISANNGNGIAIHGSSGNTIVANYIGTDVSGTLDLANAASGILLDNGAGGNTIGGTITFNNSSGLVPDTNIISGNGGNGILLTDGANNNFVASNFIGTNVSGNTALGNDLDGVAIENGASNNLLAGTFVNMSPFVFANVISGNHENGIQVQSADNNTIHANYIGLGVDNQTPVGNTLDGILVAGTSANTEIGGVIPLGNISSANGQNGEEIRDSASGTVTFNTFGGEAAFEPYTNLGNGNDGVLITSTGAGTIVRTSVLSNNHGNGLEISGNASGVQVTEVILGMNTSGNVLNPNGANGILISGTAHGNVIGGFQNSIVPQNVISGNTQNGVAITGNAYDNQVINSYIGTDVFGAAAAANGGDGVYVGAGTYSNTIGGAMAQDRDLISGNNGNGVELVGGTHGNTVSANLIGTDISGKLPLHNSGSGVLINGSSNNQIGGSTAAAANVIAFNAGAGVFVSAGTGDAILGNAIFQNLGAGIVLQGGGNKNQPAPRLTQLQRRPRRTLIVGSLRGTANSVYHIEFFANTSVDPSHNPEGQTLLGSSTVKTNRFGVANISFSTSTQAASTIFTTTATSAANNTSSFSNGIPNQIVKLAGFHRGR